MEILDKTRENVKETNKQVVIQTTGFISSAFVLVAALAWNQAIKDLITRYAKAGQGLGSEVIYAVIVSILAVLVTMRLNKLAERLKQDNTPPKQ